MSWTYRGYEGNDEHETPWYAREVDLFEAIIDALPAAGTTYVSTEHYHSKLASPDGLTDPAVSVIDTGLVGIGIAIPEYLAHIFSGNSTGVADVGADELVIEGVGKAGLSVLVGDDSEAKLFFADQDQTGYIRWYNAGIDLFPDGATQYLSARGGAFEINPGQANISTGVYWDSGVAIYVDGATGNTVINYSSKDCDTTINWDSGVGLFVRGSDGVVGVGTATLQAWRTADIESVLSFGSAGAGSIAGNGTTMYVAGNCYYDSTDSRWEYSANGRATLYTIDTANGSHQFQCAATGVAAAAITWIDFIKTLASSPMSVIFNSGLKDIDTIICGDTDDYLFLVDANADKVCISTVTPLAAKMTILQDDASGESCLSLSQADVSEGVVDCLASDRGAILATVNSAASVRWELNGIVYRLALYADA